MIEFSDEEKDVLVQKIKTYFEGELDQELGQFEAEFVLKFLGLSQITRKSYREGQYEKESIKPL